MGSSSRRLLAELPFFTATDEELLGITSDDLLLDGFQNQKLPQDGFLSFHSLKICCSNARQMAMFLEYSMGFNEVAYRGLESDSRHIASHVVRNGDVTFELVNTLEYFNDNLAPKRSSRGGLDGLASTFRQSMESSIFELVRTIIDHHVPMSNVLELKDDVVNTIVTSKLMDIHKLNQREFLEKLIAYTDETIDDIILGNSIQKFISKHGDGVFDITLTVVNVVDSYKKAVAAGAGPLSEPCIISDEYGQLKIAKVQIPATDITHTLVENINYSGPFMPGYITNVKENYDTHNMLTQMAPVNFCRIDHCVQNYSWNQMMEHATLYSRIFGFHRFWSVDEADVATENTALKSIVMASANGKIKIPINEPSKGKKRGQIEEFYDFNGGPGVQHIALLTTDIIQAVNLLNQRGVCFNTMHAEYYDELETRLETDDIILKEDFATLRKLNILVDYDVSSRRNKKKCCNYILQIFTKPLHDRPTLFIEVIQRHHHNGFGKGTFKGLFKSIEEQQEKRGTLVDA